MCRYALSGPYKDIYACFICRKSFKQVSRHDLSPEVVAQLEYKCPQCATSMVSMGQDFQAPKQNDTKQWTKVMMLYRHGFTYHAGAGLDIARLIYVNYPIFWSSKKLVKAVKANDYCKG